jgi:hypothetical protein
MCMMGRTAADITGRRRTPGSARTDGVFAARVVQHLPDSAAGPAELARGTRPGGRLVLFHPSGRRLRPGTAAP